MVIRKIDLYFQVSLGIIMIASIPFLFFYGFGAGLFILGCWQLLSSAINTYGFLHHDLGKQIKKYWIYTGTVLFILLCCVPLSKWFDPDDVQVIFWSGTACSIPIAVYYMIIYNRLIKKLEFRKELSGFTKSKS